MARGNKFSIHSFYCPMCGKKTMEIPRKMSLQRGTFHRKKLYCPWCKETLNQIEVRDEQEYLEFKKAFEEGVFTNEAKESLDYVRSSWLG